MKNVLFLFTLLSVSAVAEDGISNPFAPLNVENIQQVICKDSQNSNNLKIFTRGVRKDVGDQKGAFLLTEYSIEEGTMLSNQQYYFSADQNILSFNFIADWKAFGEIRFDKSSTSGTGFISQKNHETGLECTLAFIQ